MKPFLNRLGAVALLWSGLTAFPLRGEAVKPAGEAEPAQRREEKAVSAAPLPPEALEEARQYFSLLAGSGPGDEDALFRRSGASGSMSRERRKQWAAFVGEMQEWLRHRERDGQGRLVLEVTDSRVDGSLAAFVVSFFDERQPLDLGVLPVMMYRDGGRWTVTPFLTDFGNTRLPFEKNIRQTSRELSQWAAERSRQRLAESGEKVERRVAETLVALRKKKQWDEAPPEKLLMDWVAALKKGDALEMAALGEMADAQSSSWSARLRDAQSFVPTKERSMWEFRLSYAVGSNASLVVPLPAGEAQAGRMDLGVLNFKDTPGTPSSVSSLSFQVGDSTGGKGRTLFYPREFSPAVQKEYYAADMEEKEAEALTRKILFRFEEGMPQRKYASPMEFAADFTECVCGEKGGEVADFLMLRGRESVRDIDSVLKEREKWSRLGWGRFQQNMRERHPDWEKIKRKFSKLVKINDDKSVLMLYLTGPRFFKESYTFYLVTIERRGDSWGWGEDAGKSEFNKKDEVGKFNREIKEQIASQVMGAVEAVKLDELPACPGKVVASDFREPDDELKNWMKKTFGRGGLYQFLDRPYGVGLAGDQDTFLYYQDYEEIKLRNNGQDIRDIVFEWEEKAPRKDQTILTALQCGDWAMMGIFLRGEPLKMGAIPLIKKDGKWQPLLAGVYVTTPQRGKDGKFLTMSSSGVNKSSFYGMITTFCHRAAKIILEKNLLPEPPPSASPEKS